MALLARHKTSPGGWGGGHSVGQKDNHGGDLGQVMGVNLGWKPISLVTVPWRLGESICLQLASCR